MPGTRTIDAIGMLREDAGEKADGKGSVAGLFEIAGAAELEHRRREAIGRGLLIIVFEPARGGTRSGVRLGGESEEERGEAGGDEAE